MQFLTHSHTKSCVMQIRLHFFPCQVKSNNPHSTAPSCFCCCRYSAAAWSNPACWPQCFVSDLPWFLSRTVGLAGSNNLRMTCCLTTGCPCPFCIARNWVRCGGSSRTNGTLGPCLPFWCDPCVVCFYCPRLLLLRLCLPLGLYLALRIDLWVLTGCWLVSYCDAALYWLVDVHCDPPPAVPQDWWAVVASAGSEE